MAMSGPFTYWHRQGQIMVHRMPKPEVISTVSAMDMLEQHRPFAPHDPAQQLMFHQLNTALIQQRQWLGATS